MNRNYLELLMLCAVAICVGCNSAASDTTDVNAAIANDVDAVLSATNASERQAAADALARRGPAAEQAVSRVLRETDDDAVKLRMIDSLVTMRGFEGVPKILDSLDDASPAVRRHADHALQDLLCIRVRYDAEASAQDRAAAAQRYRAYWSSIVEKDMVEVVKDPEEAKEIFRKRVSYVRKGRNHSDE